MRHWACGLWTVVATAAVLAACNDQTDRSLACLPFDQEIGSLPDGGTGVLQCTAEGEGYAPYVAPPAPEGGVAGDGATDDAAATACGANGAKLGFMCAGCVTDTDCEPGMVCFSFPNKGGYLCTRQCSSATAATVCPPPSEGCGNNGHCKP